ncbi:hypothetical protein GOV14_06020 [Candidatus Pacearchaeota archaeon]|nr:hypothetical protein [Candidatus Pacearchaeota archaeon]
MNKKGQFDDPMQIVWGIITIFAILVIGAAMIGALQSMFCQNEKAEISRLTNELNACLPQLQNQTQLTTDLNQQCDNKIIQATEECSQKVIDLNIFVDNTKRAFITYNISFIFSLVLGISLFKFTIQWDIKNKKWRKSLFTLKIITIIIQSLATLFSISLFILALITFIRV